MRNSQRFPHPAKQFGVVIWAVRNPVIVVLKIVLTTSARQHRIKNGESQWQQLEVVLQQQLGKTLVLHL